MREPEKEHKSDSQPEVAKKPEQKVEEKDQPKDEKPQPKIEEKPEQ